MGIFRMGPPEPLVLLLKDVLKISTFIETGTYKGLTAAWAANHFEQVISIENSEVYFENTCRAYKDVPNIEFLFGDSSAVLSKRIEFFTEPVVFWLDAHWCGLDSYGIDRQCPILDEIDIILSTGVSHCILIDDARLFLSPPPLPNKIEQWPTIDIICNKLQSTNTKYYIAVFEDVIIAVPRDSRLLIAQYFQTENSKAWNQRSKAASPTGISYIKKGVKMVIRNLFNKPS